MKSLLIFKSLKEEKAVTKKTYLAPNCLLIEQGYIGYSRGKGELMKRLCETYKVEMEQFDFIGFFDWDTSADFLSILPFLHSAPQIFQLSLTNNSHFTWGQFLHNPLAKDWVPTNFVEIMAPIFSKEFLLQCLPYFIHSISGWGLDYLVSSFTESRKILNAVQMYHSQPVTSQNWVFENGKTPGDELNYIKTLFNLTL